MKPGREAVIGNRGKQSMKSVYPWCLCGAVLLIVGCQPVTYQVKITNNATFTTDFAIESDDDSAPTFVQDLAPGKSKTVSHTGQGNLTNVDSVTILSGTLVGSQITPIDAQCTTKVTANDLITVVKGADGQLTCTVTPGTRQTGPADKKSGRN